MMTKFLIAAAALLVLGACASSRYEPAYGAGGGYYFIGESTPSVRYYYVPRVPLDSYGISPWWGYSYYSPYFYPHHFYVRYTPWPYYAGWPYYPPLYAGHRYGHPPYWRYPVHHPGDDPGEGGTGTPFPGYSGPPAGTPVVNPELWRLVDERSLRREMRYSASPAGLSPGANATRSFPAPASAQAPTAAGQRGLSPGAAAARGSFRMPSTPTAGSRPVTSGRASPGRVSRHSPALHDQ